MEVEFVNTKFYSVAQLDLSNSQSNYPPRVCLSGAQNSSSITFNLANNDKVDDKYKGNMM